MTMIKIEVPNSDIDAIELAGEFFTNLARARLSTMARVVEQQKDNAVRESHVQERGCGLVITEEMEQALNPDIDTTPVEVVNTLTSGELKEELSVTYDRVENPSDLIPDTITESPKTHNATIPTPEQAEEFRESMTEMEFVTPPPIPSVPSVPSIPSVPNVTVEADDVTVLPSELPYDERIHSSGKTRNQDGTWKLRRRPAEMDEEQWKDYIEQCELENAKLMQLGGGDTSEDVEKITFEELIMKIQPQLAVPNPDFEKQCQAIATSLGLNHMSDLRRAEHLIPEFLKQLDLDGQGVN